MVGGGRVVALSALVLASAQGAVLSRESASMPALLSLRGGGPVTAVASVKSPRETVRAQRAASQPVCEPAR